MDEEDAAPLKKERKDSTTTNETDEEGAARIAQNDAAGLSPEHKATAKGDDAPPAAKKPRLSASVSAPAKAGGAPRRTISLMADSDGESDVEIEVEIVSPKVSPKASPKVGAKASPKSSPKFSAGAKPEARRSNKFKPKLKPRLAKKARAAPAKAAATAAAAAAAVRNTMGIDASQPAAAPTLERYARSDPGPTGRAAPRCVERPWLSRVAPVEKPTWGPCPCLRKMKCSTCDSCVPLHCRCKNCDCKRCTQYRMVVERRSYLNKLQEEETRHAAAEQERLFEEARRRMRMRQMRDAERSCKVAAAVVHWKAEDPYVRLNLATSATTQEIRQRFRELARKWHPDKNKAPEASDAFFRIREAYDMLTKK